MIIRPAAPQDAQKICAIWNPLIETTATTFTTERKTTQGVSADISSRDGAYFIAESDSDIIGFATYFQFRNGPGYAHTKELSINLAPQGRGKGAGQALMMALEGHAKTKGVHSLLAGISAENPGAVAFHQRMGFVEVARLREVGFKFDRWMDLVLMQKMLNERV